METLDGKQRVLKPWEPRCVICGHELVTPQISFITAEGTLCFSCHKAKKKKK